MANLVITVGHNAGSYYPLGNRTLTVGRDPARDIQLVDERAGRKHFQIRKDGDDYAVIDLRSKNGLYVNGLKVGEATLTDGDEIQAGDTVLTFWLHDTPDRTNALNRYKKATHEMRDDKTIVD